MRTPRFIAEIAEPQFRPQLRASIVSGYGTAAAFLLLAVVANAIGLVALRHAFLALIAFKVVANTLHWAALRADRAVLPASGVNVLADLVTMTGAIYLTGAELSPMVPIYAIEITVFAVLTNVRLTVSVAVLSMLFYAAMCVMVQVGWLAPMPPPVWRPEQLRPSYVAVDLAFVAFAFGLPTAYAARIVQQLREKTRALETHRDRLVEAGRLKSQFMANVTHELRTPIHGICGLCDLVESGVYGGVNDKQRDAQRSIKRSAKSLLALIDDLLELARSDAGKLALAIEPVDMGDLVTTVASAAQWMIGTRQLSVETDVEPALPKLETDPRKLNQILINLLANAVKFTGDGGRIVLRARRDGDEKVRVEVEDSGLGIPAHEVARIFDDFEQLDPAREGAYGGVGIGLSLVKRLADAMGARITVASTVGKGSTFAVTLPRTWRGRPA